MAGRKGNGQRRNGVIGDIVVGVIGAANGGIIFGMSGYLQAED